MAFNDEGLMRELARINRAEIDLDNKNAVKAWVDNTSYKYMIDASDNSYGFVEKIIVALLLLGDETETTVGLTAEERNTVMRIANDASLLRDKTYLTKVLTMFYKKADGRDLTKQSDELNLDFVKTYLHNYGFNDLAVDTIISSGRISDKASLVNNAAKVISANVGTKTIISKASEISSAKKDVIKLAEKVYENSGVPAAHSIDSIPNRIWTGSDVTTDKDGLATYVKSDQLKKAEERIVTDDKSHPLTGILRSFVTDGDSVKVETPDQIIDAIQAYLSMSDRLTTVKTESEWKDIRKNIEVHAQLEIDEDGNGVISTPISGKKLKTKTADGKKIVKTVELGTVGIEPGASFVGYDLSDSKVKKAYDLMQQGSLSIHNPDDRLAIDLLNAHKLYSSAVGLPVSPKTTTANIYANMIDQPEGIIAADGLTSAMRDFFSKIINNSNSPYNRVDINNGVVDYDSDHTFGTNVNKLFKNKTKKITGTKLKFSTRFVAYDENGELNGAGILKSDDAIKFSVIQSMVLDYVSALGKKVKNSSFKIVGAVKDNVRDPNERALIANLATQYVMLGYSFGEGSAHRTNEDIISTYLMENQASLMAGLAKSGKDYKLVLPRAYKLALEIAETVTDCLGVDKTMKRDERTGRITEKSELVANFERHGFTFPRMNSNDQPLFMSNDQKARLSGADLKKVNDEEKRLRGLDITSQDSLGALLVTCIDTQLSPREITIEPKDEAIKQADERKFAGGFSVASSGDAPVFIDMGVFTNSDTADTPKIDKEDLAATKIPEKTAGHEKSPTGKPSPKSTSKSLFDKMLGGTGTEEPKKKAATESDRRVGQLWESTGDAPFPVRVFRDGRPLETEPLEETKAPDIIYLPGKVEEVLAEELTEEDKDAVITGKQAFKDRMKKGKLDALFKEKDEKTPTKEAIYGYIDGKFYFAIRHIKTGKVTDRFETELSKTTKTKIDKAQGEEKDALIAKYAEKAAKAYKQFKNAKRDTKIEK